MVKFDREDVVVTRHRPIGSILRRLAVMDGIVAAQLREQRPPGVFLIELGIADIDRRQRALQRVCLGHRFAPVPVVAAYRSGSIGRDRAPAKGTWVADGLSALRLLAPD